MWHLCLTRQGIPSAGSCILIIKMCIRDRVHAEDGDVETGRKKFGAILGDHADIGCNSVLNPGTVIGLSLIHI